MGKCKKRTFYKSNSCYSMTREDALNNIIEKMDGKNSKARAIPKETFDMISLFGFSAEELSEAGMPYENLKALGSLIN